MTIDELLNRHTDVERRLLSRVRNILKKEGIDTVAQLVDWTDWDLRYAPSCGPLSLKTIKEILAKEGMTLATESKFEKTEQERAWEHDQWLAHIARRWISGENQKTIAKSLNYITPSSVSYDLYCFVLRYYPDRKDSVDKQAIESALKRFEAVEQI